MLKFKVFIQYINYVMLNHKIYDALQIRII